MSDELNWGDSSADVGEMSQAGRLHHWREVIRQRDDTIAALRKEVEGEKAISEALWNIIDWETCDCGDQYSANTDEGKHIKKYGLCENCQPPADLLPQAFPELDDTAQGIMGLSIGEGE